MRLPSEKTCCRHRVVAHICLCLLSRQRHLTRLQLVFSVALGVIAASSGIHHYLQTLRVMSSSLSCSLNETQDLRGVACVRFARTYVHRPGRPLFRSRAPLRGDGKRREPAAEEPAVALLAARPSCVLQQSCSVRCDQRQFPWLTFLHLLVTAFI